MNGSIWSSVSFPYSMNISILHISLKYIYYVLSQAFHTIWRFSNHGKEEKEQTGFKNCILHDWKMYSCFVETVNYLRRLTKVNFEKSLNFLADFLSKIIWFSYNPKLNWKTRYKTKIKHTRDTQWWLSYNCESNFMNNTIILKNQ